MRLFIKKKTDNYIDITQSKRIWRFLKKKEKGGIRKDRQLTL